MLRKTNSKPSIWRRVVVPAGITFSQLSIILNEVLDFDGFGNYCGFQELDASKTFIREFLEDYELNYPQVLKFKGDCPPEDCGGIWGYYDCLEVINNPSDSEYEERLERMEKRSRVRGENCTRISLRENTDSELR